MVVFESIKRILDILVAPLQGIFAHFPNFELIMLGLGFLLFSFIGWRAIK